MDIIQCMLEMDPTMKRYEAPYIEKVDQTVERPDGHINGHHDVHGIHTPLERTKPGNITLWHKKGGKLK